MIPINNNSNLLKEKTPLSINESIEIFANTIGYKNSIYKNRFIDLLKNKLSFLYKFASFKRNSQFWFKNNRKLIKRDKSLRNALNYEIITRRNSKAKEYFINNINISTIAAYVFCPVSCAIIMTYGNVESDEMYKSEELRDKKFFEKFLENLKYKRKMDFLFKEMLIKAKLIENDYSENNKHIFIIKEQFSLGNRAVAFSEGKFVEFLTRYDYGELITSKIIFKGTEQNIAEPFFSNKYPVSGIPDYIFEKQNGEKFILLEKHTWRKEVINQPFRNHIIQAACYLYFLNQLNAKYAYILYLHSIKVARLFKVNLSSDKINDVLNTYNTVYKFHKDRFSEFDVNKINLLKCFKCSSRMLCSHKSGLLKSLNLPYKIVN